jgi:MoaA/NifB/PqqE/SkfB family radical SAM enzyme
MPRADSADSVFGWSLRHVSFTPDSGLMPKNLSYSCEPDTHAALVTHDPNGLRPVWLKRGDSSSRWSLCRPWTVMYITANDRALPCCIAPFSQRSYENYTLGDATQQSLREIWNGPAYQGFRRALQSDKPPATCANCGLHWSL